VSGHTVAYTVSYPDRVARQSILELTGHAYWHAAIGAAVIGAAWFTVGHIARHFRGDTTRASVSWPALPALQLAVFIGMETSERVAAGVPLATILDHALVGIASQLLVAALLTLAMYLLGRGALAVGRYLAVRPRPVPRTAFIPVPFSAPLVHLAVVPCGSRGPPSS
jgi:hypothetical protein